MKTKMKKVFGILLSLMLALGLMPGMTMTAMADDTTSFTLTIPATLTVANSGWNATTGITAQVKSGDTYTGANLIVTATSANSWALISGDNSVGYNLATATGTYSNTATPASWEFSAAELNASGGTNKAMGIIVEDYSSKPAGTYQDTVTFVANVKRIITLQCGSETYTISFTSGQKWNEITLPEGIEIDLDGYIVSRSQGSFCLAYSDTQISVSSNEVISLTSDSYTWKELSL